MIRLGELVTQKPDYGVNASAIPYQVKTTPRFLRITDIDPSGRLLPEPKVGVDPLLAEGCAAEEGDILIARTGATVGKSYLVERLPYQAAFAGYLIRFRINYQFAAKEFIQQFLNSPQYWRWVNTTARAGAQPNINSKEFSGLPIPLPPLPEQRKIADILGTWDEALEKLDALIAAKQRRKQALMQQLLTGKKRVKGAKGKWKKVRFGDFLDESRIQGGNGVSAKKITVKLYGHGVHEKRERMTGSSNTKYYIRKAGQFIYSKLDFLNGAFGVIPDHLNGYESTLDLPSFDVRDLVDIRWLLYFVKRPEFYTRQLDSAAGGRKARRVNPSEFLAMKIDTPSKVEQSAIATILDTADQELILLQRQRAALDQQKRGLMQQLLTGKLRTLT